MKLTTKGRYAVTAMLDLALHGGQKPCSLGAIAERQGLSREYLDQLFGRLRRSGLVESVRGTEGGYRLSKAAGDISVADVLEAVGVRTDVTRCGGRGDCQGGYTCLTHHLWDDLSQRMRDFLAGISLEELSARGEVMMIYNRQKSCSARADTTRLSVV